MDEISIGKIVSEPAIWLGGGGVLIFGYFAMRVIKDIVFKALDTRLEMRKGGVSADAILAIAKDVGETKGDVKAILKEQTKTNGSLLNHEKRIQKLEQAE